MAESMPAHLRRCSALRPAAVSTTAVSYGSYRISQVRRQFVEERRQAVLSRPPTVPVTHIGWTLHSIRITLGYVISRMSAWLHTAQVDGNGRIVMAPACILRRYVCWMSLVPECHLPEHLDVIMDIW